MNYTVKMLYLRTGKRQHEQLTTFKTSASYGVVCVVLCLAILVQYRLVTDRQTDGHTTTAYNALA